MTYSDIIWAFKKRTHSHTQSESQSTDHLHGLMLFSIALLNCNFFSKEVILWEFKDPKFEHGKTKLGLESLWWDSR